MPTYESPDEVSNGLHRLLLLAVPENSLGNKTLNHLAELMTISKWAIRKWINAEKIPPERAVQVVELSEGRVSLEDFHEYVYKD